MPERIVVLAQDLIWRDRLVRSVRESGHDAVAVATVPMLAEALREGRLAIVDLTALGYDPLEAVRTAAATGAHVLGVGQHDDHAGRKAALAAGADRVLAYRKLFEDGPGTIAAWADASAARSPG